MAWPLPLYVTSTPESSCEAIQAAYWYGVAESPVAPTTTIGAAPLAVMSKDATPCTGHWTHAMLGPKYLPKIGAFFWSEVQSEKALAMPSSWESAHPMAGNAKNDVSYVPSVWRPRSWSA